MASDKEEGCKAQRKKAGAGRPRPSLRLIAHLLNSNHDFFDDARRGAGDLQFFHEVLLQFGARDHHSGSARVSPNFRQEVLISHMVENQLGACFT